MNRNQLPWFIILGLIVILVTLLFTYQMAQSVGPCTTISSAMDSEEQSFLTLLNQYRAQNGAGPLVISPGLTKAAAWMAEDLAKNNYFSHTDTYGRLPWDRAIDCGYPSTGIGENIAGGTATGAGVLAQWQSSSGHNANMLNGSWRVIGIGRVPGGIYGYTWVTDFGVVVDIIVPPTITPAPTPLPWPRGCARYIGLPFCSVFPQITRDGG